LPALSARPFIAAYGPVPESDGQVGVLRHTAEVHVAVRQAGCHGANATVPPRIVGIGLLPESRRGSRQVLSHCYWWWRHARRVSAALDFSPLPRLRMLRLSAQRFFSYMAAMFQMTPCSGVNTSPFTFFPARHLFSKHAVAFGLRAPSAAAATPTSIREEARRRDAFHMSRPVYDCNGTT